MLAKLDDPCWWFMESPRTGTSTIERSLKHIFSTAKAVYAKHWPILPPKIFLDNALSVISIRDPFSRAVSCWQYFTHPGAITFADWTAERLRDGWFDINIEARPQSFWFDLWNWDVVIEQEKLADQFWQFVHQISPETSRFELHRYNDINGHWVNRVRAKTQRHRPWYDYYCPESEKNVLELYDSDFTSLSKWYSRKVVSS
jgi:hypothetical protein